MNLVLAPLPQVHAHQESHLILMALVSLLSEYTCMPDW